MTESAPNQHPTPPASSFVFSIVETMDDVGRRVIHRKVLFGTPPSDFSEFVGLNQVIVRVGGEQGVQQPSAYKFPIDGVKTLEEAYGVWDQLARAFGDMHIAELRRQYREAQAAQAGGLVVPTPQQTKKILLPGEG